MITGDHLKIFCFITHIVLLHNILFYYITHNILFSIVEEVEPNIVTEAANLVAGESEPSPLATGSSSLNFKMLVMK